MDPLSITAAVVGLLTAGTSVTDLLQNLRNAPELAKVVIREVESITRCLRSLQCFLDGSVTAHHSRTALIMIDEVRVVLTNCVSTISELKDSLAKLGLNGQTRIVDRLKWAAKEKAITNILLRLQSSRISMNLMLTTLNCHSLEQAAESSAALRSLILKLLDNDDKLARRFNEALLRGASIYNHDIESVYGQDTIRPEDERSQCLRTQLTNDDPVLGATFEKDLQATRVYSRLTNRRSEWSLPSSAGQSRGWSFLSDVSLSDVSNLSIVSLPIDIRELCKEFQDFTLPSIALATGINELDAELFWPKQRVVAWFRNAFLPVSVLEHFLGNDISGFAILCLKRRHMVNYSSEDWKQAALWRAVRRIQTCILHELSGIQSSKTRSEMPNGLYADERIWKSAQELIAEPKEGTSNSASGNDAGSSTSTSNLVDCPDFDENESPCCTALIRLTNDIASSSFPGLLTEEYHISEPVDEEVAQYHKILVDSLRRSPHASKGNRVGRAKLSALSPKQLVELVNDIADEIVRRQRSAEQSGPHEVQEQEQLPPRDEFHPKRNAARAKLARLSSSKLCALVTDTHSELERRYPSLKDAINEHIDGRIPNAPESPIPSQPLHGSEMKQIVMAGL